MLDDVSLVAVQGPKAVNVVSMLAKTADLKDFKFMTGRRMELGGIPVYISRCGYTGEDGFEVSFYTIAFFVCLFFVGGGG